MMLNALLPAGVRAATRFSLASNIVARRLLVSRVLVTRSTRLRSSVPHDTPVAAPAFTKPEVSVAPSPPLKQQSNQIDIVRALRLFAALSKLRLGMLVVATTAGGFLMAPGISIYSAPILTATVVGTALCVSSANTINQVIEVKQDSIMRRTFNRPIAAGHVSRTTAAGIGAACGVAGVASLYAFVNPLTAALGFANIVLYTGVYTPLKQRHVSNTWVGAIVGAIPPVMGWTAHTNSIGLGAGVLFGLLYLWQMPHFFALSYLIKDDYASAGFKMLVCEDPVRTAHLSLVYSLPLFAVAPAAWAISMTSPWFMLDASLATAAFAWTMWCFRAEQSKKTARRAFFASIVYLPVLMGLMIVHKTDDSEERQSEQQADEAAQEQS